ncbi:conserved hypothetical protein [Chlorobaculum tepidum TLS]|uniref:Uncharacterized protein n=1 Tax=Chlorobaculum tepidum (strain ATCC 49652 / DSM 12025 / NBRC 103806 / TLS) TaxID=194439 RepID=Q8KDH9_CHLTE|nr:conserved hypothetical protein [Chlorobaculum tepidum TLS]
MNAAHQVAFPDFGSLILFDLLVVITAIALSRDFNEDGINDLSGFGKDTLIVQGGVEPFEEKSFNHAFLDQALTKLPDGFGIENPVAGFESQKALETEPIGNLVFHLIIRKTVEALQDEELEHRCPVKRRSAHFAQIGRLLECDLKNWAEEIPVDMLFQFHQWIFELGQTLRKKILVEKAQGIDVLHGNEVD